jgi:MATE family multidrug resistance protein
MSPDAASLSWNERPFAALLRLAWPIAVSLLSYSAMTFVDTLFVARLGTASLAGMGLAFVAGFSLLCFPLGLLQGVKVLVSQAIGAGRQGDIDAYLRAGLLVAVILGLVCLGVTHLMPPLLDVLAASPEAGGVASTYLRIRMLSAPVFLVFIALRETAYGTGDTRGPMLASLIANLANIALCTVFVLGFDLGVVGVAWATACANFVEVGVLVVARPDLVRRALSRAGRAQPWGPAVAAVWRMGLPTGGQFVLEIGSFSLLTIMVSAMSEIEMAAHQIVLQVLHVAFLPVQALGEAGSVLAGQAVGADRDDLVGRVARRALIGAGVFAFLCTLAGVFGAELVLRAFTGDPALTGVAVRLIHIAALFLIIDASNVVARSVLRGTGDVRFAAVVGIASAWCMTPPLTWLLGYHLEMGVSGAWLGLCAEILLGAAILWWRLVRGGWRQAAARSRAEVLQARHALAGSGEPGSRPAPGPAAGVAAGVAAGADTGADQGAT